MKGKIILLNGVSSSGKTTLAKELQRKCTSTLYYHAIDEYLSMLPDELPVDRLKDFVSILKCYPVLMVNVTCDIEELKQREIARGDRPLGTGESQIHLLEPQEGYDIIVDTSKKSAEECAEKILSLFDNPKSGLLLVC